MQRLSKVLVLSLALSSASAFAKPAKRRPARRPAAAAPAPAADDAPMAAAPADDSTAAAPAPDPKPAEVPPPPPPKPVADAPKDDTPPPPPSPTSVADLAKLRADYDKLRDELFRSRSRAALVQEGLYNARLGAVLEWKSAPDYQIRRAEIRLDGGTIWDSGDKPVTDDKITVGDRPCKPGPHALTVRLEIRPGTKKKGLDIEGLGYVTEQTFSLAVPDGKLTTVVLTGDEDGSLPEYEPRLELELESKKLEK